MYTDRTKPPDNLLFTLVWLVRKLQKLQLIIAKDFEMCRVNQLFEGFFTLHLAFRFSQFLVIWGNNDIKIKENDQ